MKAINFVRNYSFGAGGFVGAFGFGDASVDTAFLGGLFLFFLWSAMDTLAAILFPKKEDSGREQ